MPPIDSFEKHAAPSPSFEWLRRIWWQLRYAQPLHAVRNKLSRQDEYLAWFNTVATPVLRPTVGKWHFCERAPSMVGAQAFQFFGVERVLSDNRGWHWMPWGETWLYNLHAFDDLVADGASARHDWHQKMMTNWMVANSPGKGMGWRAPSLARRIVNWIKWDLVWSGLNEVGRRNVILQVRFLRQRLGASLSSAYPTKAGKALIFAGAFFEGVEADAWRRTGLSLLRNAVKPGFVKSKIASRNLYRISMAEDLLDLVQLARIYPGLFSPQEVRDWQSMATELLALDSAQAPPAVANESPAFYSEPTVSSLRHYSDRLGLSAS